MSWNQDSRTCWDLKTLTAVSGFEAITASRAIFNATHTPLPIVRRTELTPFDGGARSTELDLLTEFFTSDNTDGALIIPVIGDRGVGKSHIIRFLFENRPTDSKAHVVYIPKSGTDLRATISLIIEGLDERFDDVRASLATAQVQNPNPSEAVERLLVELYLKIERRASQPLVDDNATTTALMRLSAALLNDSVFRQQFSQRGGPRRIVAGPLGEDIEVADDKRIVFTIEDLPFGDLVRDQLAETARAAYTQFSMSTTAQKKFLQYINEVLPAALQEVFWSNGPKLTTLLRDVRHLLLEDDREIFLLIEDLVVLSGLQEELLQAFITPAVESPGQPQTLAPLRVAFAMTNEPFRAIQETVVSRVKSVYAIDLSQNQEETNALIFGSDDQIAFLSKYLNASRYSIDEISEFDKSHLGEKLPSKCDNCRVADSCLSDFGSHDGIGMYPFTTPALTNLLGVRSKQSFNPRVAIRGVLAEVLREAYNEIPLNEFPSDQVMDAFKKEQNAVPLEVMNDIQLRFNSDTPRRINLQRFWTANRDVRDPWTAWIRSCFGLGDDSTRIPIPREDTPDEKHEGVISEPSGDTFAYLDVWATAGEVIIPENSARILRTALYQLVSGQLEDRYGISISKPISDMREGEFLRRDSFIIAQAGGGGGVSVDSEFWTTKIDISISTALMFKLILQSSATGNQLPPAKLSEVYRFLEPMIQGAKSEYELRYGDLSEEIEQLNFFAGIFGNSDDLLDDLLSEQLELNRLTEGRGSQWIELLRKWTELRFKSLEKILAITGASKGDGGTLSTRASLLLSNQTSHLSTLADEALVVATEELSSDSGKLENIAQLLDGHEPHKLFSELRDLFSEVGLHLPGQLIPQTQLLELSRRLDAVDTRWNSELLDSNVSSGLSAYEVIKTVAQTDATLIAWFLKELTEILTGVDGIVTRANQIGNGDGNSNATLLEIQSSISDIQQTLGQLK
jgi:hypothetical protein